MFQVNGIEITIAEELNLNANYYEKTILPKLGGRTWISLV